MEYVRWTNRPALRRPVLVAAFEGWNDAGDAATTAVRHLRDSWDAEPFATVEPEEFHDFTSTRPQVRLADGATREIVWPETTLYAATRPEAPDAVVLLGNEPQLRWRTFCAQIIGIAKELDVSLVLTLGALLADVPHTRPTSIVGTAVDPALVERFGLRRSNYEGPTGIVGVLQDAVHRAGLSAASLWAAVPAYVPGAPSPKAALALVERATDLLGTAVTTTELEIASASYERQVTEVVAGDEEMTEYVEALERRYDPTEAFPSVNGLVEEVEKFLRDQRRPD